MIKYNNSNINDWFFSTDNIIKVYRNNAVCYYKVTPSSGAPQFDVCYAVVDNIQSYSGTEFTDVYDSTSEKWYKLNNLNEYEEYGVYGTGRNITYYQGKLTIDGNYEYIYSGSSWVSVGEVSGGTATLPSVPFVLNYNAKNYDATTHTIPQTSGQLNCYDATAVLNPTSIVDHSADGYITIPSTVSMQLRKSGEDISLFNRTNTSSGSSMTIVSKVKTTAGNSVITNRDSKYNWMYRQYNNKLTLHGTSEFSYISCSSTNPDIMSVRTEFLGVSTNVKIKYNNWTSGTTASGETFAYGNTNADSGTAGALFVGYGWNQTSEAWNGDFYWVYMSQNTLTDEQVQQVIDYNEGGGSYEYPLYYEEKQDPLDNLSFSSITEAVNYAYSNCVYDGMKATIDGDRYYFDSEDENGWVKMLSYYKVEDVTPSGTSGWTITGSSTYNPDSSYYDDFSVENTTTTNKTFIAKVTIFGYDHFTYYLRSTGRTSYAYVTATNVDELNSNPTSYIGYDSNSAITHTYYWPKTAGSAVNLSNYRRVTYNNLDKTVEHTFYVSFYGRNYSNYGANATILIPKEQTNENWEQVAFSASTNVGGQSKSLYIDGNYNTSGGTGYFYYRWMVGLPSGSHNSYANFSSYDYCSNTTSSTFTSVAGEQRQVNYTWNSTTNKTLQFRLVDESGNTLSPSDAVYYNMSRYNSCGVMSSSNNQTYPKTYNDLKVGGYFVLTNSSSRAYIYGYNPLSSMIGVQKQVNDYTTYFDIIYSKLDTEAVTITYTTYDPNDTETPTFSTDISWPYGNSGKTSNVLTSYDVPYGYSYSATSTNNLFSASTASYSYTAGQATRTIDFGTLYPNNREFSTVADMEAYAYAWEGMEATVEGTRYVYTNGEWIVKKSRLPNGYTELEYIENSTSTQNTQRTNMLSLAFADSVTNDASAYTYSIVMELTAHTQQYENCFGYGYVELQRYNNQRAIVRSFGREENVSAFNPLTNKFKFKIWKGENDTYPTYYLENLTQGTSPITGYVTSNRSMTNNYNKVGLFHFANERDTGAYTPKGRIYEVTVEDRSGNLVCNGVPCKRDSDGKLGFYNLARNEFEYDESGVLSLTGGPEV